MERCTPLRLSPLRIVGATSLFLLPSALLAFMVVIGFRVGSASGVIIASALLPVALLCLSVTASYGALGIYFGLRAWRSGYRICIDEAAGLLRDSDGRVARLDRTQTLASFGKPPFEVCVLHGTAPEGLPASRGLPARLLRLGLGPVAVLDAIGRGDLVVPLAFIRRRGRVARLLRRCSVVRP